MAAPYLLANEDESGGYFRQGVVWSYLQYEWEEFSFFRYTLDGDTTINDKLYQKMYRFTSCEYSRQGSDYIGAVREDSCKVYCQVSYGQIGWLPNENGEEVAYDFNLQVGDSVERGDYTAAYVTKVDTIMIENMHRKRLFFDVKKPDTLFNESDYEYDVWIEGIGSTNRTFFESLFAVPTCPCGNDLNVFNNSEGITVYTNTGYHKDHMTDDCFYNPVGLQTTVSNRDVRFYTQCGMMRFDLPPTAYKLSLYTMDGLLLESYMTKGYRTLTTPPFAAGLYVFTVTDANHQAIAKGKVRVE
jgi:hypothetical protein